MFEDLTNQKGLSLDRLITLCRIADCGSIGEAASRYGGSGSGAGTRQAQFSRQIDELEKFFAVDLLDRQQKPYRLSRDGEELTTLARHFLGGLEDYQGTRGKTPKRLVVGAGESLIQWFLMPRWMDSWKDLLPGCSIIFKNLQTEKAIEKLVQGEIDLAFVRDNAVKKPLEKSMITEFDYHCFMPRAFRGRPEGKTVRLKDLEKFPMAALEGEGQFRRKLEEAFEKAGVKPHFEMECSSSTQLAKAVERRQYCAVLPAYAAGQLPDHVIEYRIEDFKEQRRLCFAWNPKRITFRPIIESALDVIKRDVLSTQQA